MKKSLLLGAALLSAAASFAQSETVADWGKDGQAFNSNNEFVYNDDNTELTISFTNAADKGMRRAEIGNKVPMTVGGNYTVVVFKVTYENAEFLNFDKNVIYVRQQLREGAEGDAIEPSFITNQNQNAGRIQGETANVAYGWRYLPGLGYNPAPAAGTVDWTKDLLIQGSFANNKAFTWGDKEDIYGYSYIGIRLVHSQDATTEDEKQGTLDDTAKATFNYIEVADVTKLDNDFANLDNAKQGKAVKAYIEDALASGSSAVKALEAAEGEVEYFNLQGVRVANPSNGIFVRRQGNKVSKVAL